MRGSSAIQTLRRCRSPCSCAAEHVEAPPPNPLRRPMSPPDATASTSLVAATSEHGRPSSKPARRCTQSWARTAGVAVQSTTSVTAALRRPADQFAQPQRRSQWTSAASFGRMHRYERRLQHPLMRALPRPLVETCAVLAERPSCGADWTPDGMSGGIRVRPQRGVGQRGGIDIGVPGKSIMKVIWVVRS